MAIMPLADALPGEEWVPIEQVGESLARIEIVPVPVAYRPDRFLAAVPATRRAIRAAIGKADYLSFAIGGLFGDWGSVACFEAYRMRRPYAVWTDRVESEVVRLAATRDGRWRVRLRARMTHRPMAWLERAVIRQAEVGLFHGRETYEAYAPFEVVHDVAVSAADHIARRRSPRSRRRSARGRCDWLMSAGPIRRKGRRTEWRCWSG
jgi:colanic acid/amylovoran biosynthesis glycosyltransferase